MRRGSFVVAAVVAGVAIAAGSFELGRRGSAVNPEVPPASQSVAKPAGSPKVLYWHDPMVPGQRFDKPGRSPFMDMQLVPVYADADAGDGGVKVSPTVQQNLGMRTATVKRADVSASFDAVGTVQFDERLSVAVQTRVAGYVERLDVRAPMERVRKGQVLATVFAPDWLAPQNEWLALQKAGAAPDLIVAARERMRAMSIPESLIRRSEQGGRAQASFTLEAPVSGVVAELGVREGVAVTPGMTLFRLAGLESVWAVAEVPEAQALRLVRGQKVKAVLQADASRTFDGELEEILPQVSANTRTLQARFAVDNHAGRLTPGMLLRLQVAGPSASHLVIPSEAVIRTGRRTVVLVRKENGAFESRDVAIGPESGDDIEVTQGLAEGEQVVASGQFLIDSEARLRSMTDRLAGSSAVASGTAASEPETDAPRLHVGEGKVERTDAAGITISHGPVASLKWPAMTMGFDKPDAKAFADIRPGDTVRFEFRESATGYQLVTVRRLGASK